MLSKAHGIRVAAGLEQSLPSLSLYPVVHLYIPRLKISPILHTLPNSGRRKMLAVRDLLQTKPAVSGPCAQHTQATKQQITTGSSNQTKQPQNKLATKGAAAVTAPNNRQLLQAPTPKPKGPLTPAQRRGFATGRSGAPNPKQQRRPPVSSIWTVMGSYGCYNKCWIHHRQDQRSRGLARSPNKATVVAQ
jgi:hypothetical protein